MLNLIHCGYNFIHTDGIYINRPAGSGNYAFVFFKSKAKLVISGQEKPVEENMWILLRPSTSYSYKDTEKPFINDWFHFEGDDIEAILKELDLPVDEPAHSYYPSLISRAVMELQSSSWLGGPYHEQIIELELRSFLMKLSNSRQLIPASDNSARYFRKFFEIRSKLYNSPYTRYSVNALASEVNLSKSYFQHIYKDLFGCPVSLDMIHGRLEYAKYLLENSPLSVEAVAKDCGYENETHFMRQFKKFIGKTPSQYRSLLRSTNSNL